MRIIWALLIAILATSAGASSAAGIELDLSTYIQNPGEWIKSFSEQLGDWHVMASLSLFCLYLTGGLSLYVIIFKGAMRANWTIVYMTMFRALIVIGLLTGLRAGTGPVWTVIDRSTSGWISLYNVSAGLANKEIKKTVEKGTADMATAAQNYLMAAGAASGIAEVITTAQWHSMDNALDDSTVRSLVSAEMAAREKTPVDQASWIVQLGYLIIIGFFSLYVMIILGSAMSLVIGTLFLPIGLTAWGIGDSKILRHYLMSVLASWLIVILTPLVMILASKVAIEYPQKILVKQVEEQTTKLEGLAYRYRDEVVKCMDLAPTGPVSVIPDWLSGDNVCAGMKSFFIQIKSGLESFYNMIRGFIIFVISLIIGQAVGAAFLRRVPALLAGGLMTAVDSSASSMRMVGLGAVNAAMRGAGMAAAGPTRAAATTAGRALVGGANAGAAAGVQAGAAARDATNKARLAGAMHSAVDREPGQTAQQAYSNASARLHPSNGRQTGPQPAYTGNRGGYSDTRGTAAQAGKSNRKR